jgi:hypothetical protein
MEDLAFRIGATERQHVVVRSIRRAFPEATNDWDADALLATIEVAAGAFRGEFDVWLFRRELVSFREQLGPLYEKLIGRATLASLDGWLTIDVESDGKGHFRAECVADDQPGIGNKLRFTIEFDQTELPEIVRSLEAICDALA